jgi:hypothetical protein
MSDSDNFGHQKDTGALIKILFIHAPNKNLHALLEISKQTDIFYRKHGVSKFVYRLNTQENMMDFINLSKAISANDDEDVWLEILSYRDAKHIEEVMKAMELYKESMEIITP